MATSAPDLFKNALDKAYSGIKPNLTTMTDHAIYKQGVKEEDSEDKGIRELDKNEQGMVYGIADILKKVDDISNRRRLAKDMVNKFKREKIKFDYKKFLSLCDLGEDKKEETKEATGSGSSGAYVGPVFGGDDAFWERSRRETPKLGESEVEKVEAKEATTSGSVGGYESPSMWAKSTKKKDWGPSRKTQIPGGGFVKIKKKCTKFPYCNQGDINAVKISKNESVKEAIKRVSKKMGVSENVIMTILEHEYEKINKRHK
jgi:hypothetical protein